jgi:hypothetical protein
MRRAPPSPARSAARAVRSRAAASNDAGTARYTSWAASGTGMAASHAARRWRKYAAWASTGDSRGTSPGAFQGRIGWLGSTPTEQSHDFADATTRAGTSAPRARASSPTTCSACPHGSARLSGFISFAAGR